MIPTMSTQTPWAIGILGSGRGTNAQAILDAIAAGRLNARVVCVISDVENALILARARKQGIPAEYLSAAPFKTKLEGEAERRYIETLRQYGAQAVALASTFTRRSCPLSLGWNRGNRRSTTAPR